MSAAAHLVTFGSLPLYGSTLARIQREAHATGYFASVTAYTQETLPELQEHAAFIAKSKKGYGYWIWKPLIILKRMAELPDGELVLYVDGGCSLHRCAAAWASWVRQVQEHPSGRLAFTLTTIEEEWTKAGVLDRFGVRGDKRSQILATISLWVNSEDNRRFLREWYATMVADDYICVTDAPMSVPNPRTFCKHRHDQSIFSLMIKRDGAAILADPGSNGDDQPVKITRIRRC
jgi:hypothetical protein